jgi:hypothetical protein
MIFPSIRNIRPPPLHVGPKPIHHPNTVVVRQMWKKKKSSNLPPQLPDFMP